MIIFVHTPKCGGKSVRAALKETYGDRLKLYYLNPLKRDSMPAIPYLFRPHWPDQANTDIVYGHFCFDKFALYGLLRPVRRAMFFRHPIDLVCSSYFYRRDQLYRRNKRADEYQNMTLLEYAERQDRRHIFESFLGHTSIEDLDFIGLQEHFDASIELFGKTFGKQLTVHRVNQTRNKPVDYRRYLEEEGLIKPMLQCMQRNLVIFEQAEKRFRELMANHGLDSLIR
jgi:hypothetical protein